MKNNSKIFNTYFGDLEMSNILVQQSKNLFNQGDKIDYIYFIDKGGFNVIKDNKLLWQASKNEFIGISSFFSEEDTYSYTVRAITETSVYKIPIDVFKYMIKKSANLNSYIMKIFCSRINATLNKKENISYISKKRKVIKILIDKAKMQSNFKATLNYNTNEIAKMINIPKKIVTRVLNELHKKNLLNVNGDKIEITDFYALKLTL
jgi:CRP-like cAMP-binding protein